jgi:hypothetical protein
MKTTILLAIVAATSSVGLGIFSQHVNAAPGSGATLASGFPCSIGPGGSTTQSHEVLTPSGQETEQCHGDTAPVTTGSGGATVIKGVPCTLGPIQHGVTTTEMQAEVTPSGHVNLNCHS